MFHVKHLPPPFVVAYAVLLLNHGEGGSTPWGGGGSVRLALVRNTAPVWHLETLTAPAKALLKLNSEEELSVFIKSASNRSTSPDSSRLPAGNDKNSLEATTAERTWSETANPDPVLHIGGDEGEAKQLEKKIEEIEKLEKEIEELEKKLVLLEPIDRIDDFTKRATELVHNGHTDTICEEAKGLLDSITEKNIEEPAFLAVIQKCLHELANLKKELSLENGAEKCLPTQGVSFLESSTICREEIQLNHSITKKDPPSSLDALQPISSIAAPAEKKLCLHFGKHTPQPSETHAPYGNDRERGNPSLPRSVSTSSLNDTKNSFKFVRNFKLRFGIHSEEKPKKASSPPQYHADLTHWASSDLAVRTKGEKSPPSLPGTENHSAELLRYYSLDRTKKQ